MAWITDHSVNWLLVWYSCHGLNNRPFSDRTCLDHLNTGLVRNSDCHWTDFLCSFDLFRCQNKNGGFGGGPGQVSHLAPTYAAVNALAIIGGEVHVRYSNACPVFRSWEFRIRKLQELISQSAMSSQLINFNNKNSAGSENCDTKGCRISA